MIEYERPEAGRCARIRVVNVKRCCVWTLEICRREVRIDQVEEQRHEIRRSGLFGEIERPEKPGNDKRRRIGNDMEYLVRGLLDGCGKLFEADARMYDPRLLSVVCVLQRGYGDGLLYQKRSK